jgi:hypothetical protein
MTTSKRVGKVASKQLRNKRNPKRVKEVAGSDLAQRRGAKRKGH